MKDNSKPKAKGPIIITMGLALFATQFGAGNLIFPPFLGRETGSNWLIGFAGFFIMDVGLAALAIYSVVANREGTVDGVTNKLGAIPGKVFVSIILLLLGPIICIPRTSATTYEMGIKVLLPGVPLWAFSLLFFIVTAVLALNPSGVVDIIGKFLTPLLLLVMIVLIVLGIVNPIGAPIATKDLVPFQTGITNGYQTLDGIGGVTVTTILIIAAKKYGYTERNEVKKLVAGADIISATLLGLVYGGLSYLGASTASDSHFDGLAQAPLLIAITNKLLGGWGVIALAIIILLACLTTSIGLSSVIGDYFAGLSNGKVSYRTVVLVTIGFSFFMSNLGLDKIIALAAPILSAFYPPLIVLVIFALLDKWITSKYVGGIAAYTVFFTSLLSVLHGFGLPFDFIKLLPFTKLELGWVVPAIVGALIGFIYSATRRNKLNLLEV
nr:branched-chain amino acid transport system II carrier protein [uncultured Mogibacterium sp.]